MKPPKVPGGGSGVAMALRHHLNHIERTERGWDNSATAHRIA
jgi:hypothetical protein